MHLRFALVASAIALHTTTAFLIPPQIHDAAVAAEARIEGLLSSIEFVEELDCPGCPYAGTKDGSDAWEYGIENKIVSYQPFRAHGYCMLTRSVKVSDVHRRQQATSAYQ